MEMGLEDLRGVSTKVGKNLKQRSRLGNIFQRENF
jgi:hypothetical protein